MLGPVLYLLNTSPVPDILRHHNMAFHLYAHDTQLLASFSCNDDLRLQRTLSNIEKCLYDIQLGMSANKLKLNKDKTDLIYFYSKYSPQSFIPLYFGADLIQPSQHVRDIGVIFSVPFPWDLRLTPSLSLRPVNCATLLATGSIYLLKPLSSLSTPLSQRS